MGNADSLPDRINEEQAKLLAGELWNQYIFDALVDENGLASKQDVVDSASEALMAFQGESVEIMRVTCRKKKSILKVFTSNQELGRSIYERKKSKKNEPQLEICQMAHLGQFDDLVAMCEMTDADILDAIDPKLNRTALQLASTYNFIDIIEYLVEKGCNIDKLNSESKTALHYAAQYGNWDAVALLMKKGASPDVKDSLGRFAGDWVESDYSGEGFIKQDQSRFDEMLALLSPTTGHLYKGPRTGKENDPPSAEVVAVEITNNNFQVHANNNASTKSGLNHTSKSLRSEGSASSVISAGRRTSAIAAQ